MLDHPAQHLVDEGGDVVRAGDANAIARFLAGMAKAGVSASKMVGENIGTFFFLEYSRPCHWRSRFRNKSVGMNVSDPRPTLSR